MQFVNFSLYAEPFINKATCRVCRGKLTQVPNGFISIAMYCPECENVYTLKLVKVPNKKLNQDFIDMCRDEVRKTGESE